MNYSNKLFPNVLAAFAFVMFACQSPKNTKVLYPENEIPISSSSNEAIAELVKGLEIQDLGNEQKARPHFEKALELDPNFVSAQMYRSFNSSSPKDWSENRDKFLAMRDKANEGETIMMDIFSAYMENDDLKAVELSKQLVSKYPNSARAYDQLAQAYRTIDDTENARANWKKAIELNPNFIPAISNLGRSYLFSSPKDYAIAQKNMEKVVTLAPESSMAHIDLGDCYRAQDNLDKALEHYTKASNLDPQDEVAFAKMGHANSFLGNFDEARKNYQNARAVSEFGVGFYHDEACTYLYQNDHEKALAFLMESAKEVEKTNAPESNKTIAIRNCIYPSAMIAMHHGKTDQLNEIVELMKMNSEQVAKDVGAKGFTLNEKARMHYFNAMVLASQGNFEEAINEAEMIRAILEPSNDPNKLRNYHRAHTLINYKQENYDAALEHASKLDPDNVYDQYWMAKVNEMVGNTDIAMDMYKEIANHRFNNVGYALIRNEVNETLANASL